MSKQYLILEDVMNIDGVQVEICKDGYGLYHALAYDNPYFNISDHDANKKDIIDIATHAISAWQRFTEEKGYD